VSCLCLLVKHRGVTSDLAFERLEFCVFHRQLLISIQREAHYTYPSDFLRSLITSETVSNGSLQPLH